MFELVNGDGVFPRRIQTDAAGQEYVDKSAYEQARKNNENYVFFRQVRHLVHLIQEHALILQIINQQQGPGTDERCTKDRKNDFEHQSDLQCPLNKKITQRLPDELPFHGATFSEV
jgi:hypothetical protein